MLFSRKTFPFFVLFNMAYTLPVIAETKAQATETAQFQCAMPTFTPIVINAPKITDDSIRITSKYSSIEKDQLANFSGGVTLIDKSQTIKADQLAFDRLLMTFNAQGNIHYQSQSIDILASELNANKKDKKSSMLNASYQLYGNPGHGSADELQISTAKGLSLLDSTFTTCAGDEPD